MAQFLVFSAVAICVLPVPGPPVSTMFSVSSRNSQRCRGFVNATFTVRFSQLASVSANASSLLTLFLTGYFGCVSPLARYFLIVVRERPVLFAISRIDRCSRACQRRITLNKSTSSTPFDLLQSHQQEQALHVGQFWMQISLLVDQFLM